MPRDRDQKSELETLRGLNGRKRWEHIWTYYKLPIFAVLIVLYCIGYGIYRQATHKDTVLCTALVNVAAGEELTEHLTADFLQWLTLPANKNEVIFANGLPLTESDKVDRQYTYASEMKLLAMMEAQQLDVVLMDAEARDAFVRNEYLLDLRTLLAGAGPELWDALSAYVTGGGYCLDASFAPCLRQAGFGAQVYLGVIANTMRAENAANYIRFLQNSGGDTEK